MSRAVVLALESALDTLATDATTYVALLRGAGPRGFSAGADISEFPALLEPDADTRGEGIQRLADRVEAFPKPLIVAIHGFCMGGGLEIARARAAQSPHVLAVIKALLRETSGAPLRDGLRTETAAFARLLAHRDAREGIAAFLEKRQARWAAQADGHADA